MCNVIHFKWIIRLTIKKYCQFCPRIIPYNKINHVTLNETINDTINDTISISHDSISSISYFSINVYFNYEKILFTYKLNNFYDQNIGTDNYELCKACGSKTINFVNLLELINYINIHTDLNYTAYDIDHINKQILPNYKLYLSSIHDARNINKITYCETNNFLSFGELSNHILQLLFDTLIFDSYCNFINNNFINLVSSYKYALGKNKNFQRKLKYRSDLKFRINLNPIIRRKYSKDKIDKIDTINMLRIICHPCTRVYKKNYKGHKSHKSHKKINLNYLIHYFNMINISHNNHNNTDNVISLLSSLYI